MWKKYKVNGWHSDKFFADLSTYLKSLPAINSDQPVSFKFYAFA